jgi:hypothetical protein
MSASKAGPPFWSYYNDFWQTELVYCPMPDHAGFLESMRMLREYELQTEIEAFELWRDDPAFDEEDE